jgi:hypothetical protein
MPVCVHVSVLASLGLSTANTTFPFVSKRKLLRTDKTVNDGFTTGQWFAGKTHRRRPLGLLQQLSTPTPYEDSNTKLQSCTAPSLSEKDAIRCHLPTINPC